jgi:2-polyprenyl-6-methoxyphenol hydroxylase-like FAD-dependent oxidoreductase
MHAQRRLGRAVIIGGSMAGLLGARVLADHFEQVILLERDPLPEGPDARKSVPQGRHLHGLLAGGRELLGELFPGLEQELLDGGAILSDVARDTAWFHCGAWKERYVSGIQLIHGTRLFLEWKIRGRVAALPNVSIRYGCSVEALLTDAAKTRITGVQFKTSQGEETLEADLIVDTGGRGSRAPRWLEALGFGRPEEEEIHVDLGYTSRLYETPTGSAPDWKFLFVNPRAPGWRSGLVQCVEGGRWMVTFVSYFGDHAPTDPQGFLEFARSLPTPDVYEAIRDARPISEPTLHKVPSSLWRHYERMERQPENFVTFGDAVCAFNPFYGQGMTVASQSARLLGECIAKQAPSTAGELRGLPRDFQRKLAKLLSGPWTLGASTDLRFPQARGRRYPGLSLVHWSLDTLADMTSQNTAACHQFHEVVHMRKGPESWLKSPSFLASFITYGLKSFFVPLPERARVNSRPPPPT